MGETKNVWVKSLMGEKFVGEKLCGRKVYIGEESAG